MSNRIELPLIDPLYSTYHNQGVSTAIGANNPSIRNWDLNNNMNLTCNRKFLQGFTTPEITIAGSPWFENPYIEKMWISTRFTKGYINPIIKEMLNQGYYVLFIHVDDYYVEGKSCYKERHLKHDGLICGCDQDEKTYCIYAYDNNWIYRKFWTPQKAFNNGRIAMRKKGIYTNICAIKVKEDEIKFEPVTVYNKLKEYLDSNIEKYPFEGEGNVFGIVVHEYMAEYLSKLQSGEIPYKKMDWRIFRVIWEHKKAMLERIVLIEQIYKMGNGFSEEYKSLVKEADTIRMLYASYHLKLRDAILPVIKKKLLTLMESERELLTLFVERLGKELEK